MVHPAAASLPVLHDPLKLVLETVDEAVHRLTRSCCVGLDSNHLTVEVDVGLRGDRAFAARVTVADYAQAAIQHRMVDVGK
jgi:hypothetical protein